MAESPNDEALVSGYFIIVYLSLILYGIVVSQMYAYALQAKKDPLILRMTVVLVGLCETAHTGLMLHSTYLLSVSDFGHPQELAYIPRSAGASIILGMIIIACVQVFYIRRIYILSRRNLWLTILVSVILFIRAPFSYTSAGLMYSLGTWNAFRAEIGPLVAVCFGLGLSALVDVTITVIMIYFLYQSKTGFKATDRVIYTLMAYTVNSGLVTVICSILSLVSFFVLPQSLVFAGLIQMSTKLYANSLLGTLNAREHLRGSKFMSSAQGTRAHTSIRADEHSRPIEIFQETFKIASHEQSSCRSAGDAMTLADTNSSNV